MSTELWSTVDNYLEDLFVRDPILEQVLEASTAAGLPPIAVSPSQGKMLHLLARIHNARRILEIGTLGGYSTIWLAKALPTDGCLITLEADPKHAEVAKSNFVRAGLSSIIDLRLGKAIDTLPQLVSDGSGPFDLIFIDADKEGYPNYLDWSLKLSKPGTLIIADNVVRKGMVIDTMTKDPSIEGARRFNEMLANEPRLSATVVQTVGVKGYDGFALAIVKAA